MDHPAFLVIGAMKAGTTSLFHDLMQSPAIHLPEKEPACLVRYSEADALTAYRKLFRQARSGQIVGESSTGYSMLPLYPGIPERAVKILGRDLRILYLVRNPIHRTLSHHYHAMSYRDAPADPVAALQSQPLLIDASRYGMQLEPWLAQYPAAQVHVIIAEEYYAARNNIVNEICRFLGVPEVGLASTTVHGAGEERRIGRWSAVRKSGWYRRRLAPYLPPHARKAASRLLLAKGPARPLPPDMDCLLRLRDVFLPDVENLTRRIGRSSQPWDLDETIRCLADSRNQRGIAAGEAAADL